MEMKKDAHVSSWEECEQRLLQIENDNSKSLAGVWFRGLSNACWGLTTEVDPGFGTSGVVGA
jgi:hypothetical protein